MKTQMFEFESLAEAKAFLEGIAYVNDSAIDARIKRGASGRRLPAVEVNDADGHEDEED